MSVIELENANLVFRVMREKRIKDWLIPGSGFDKFGEDGSVHALKDLSLTVREGERVAIIGHNGAGKSTLLKMVSNIYPPTSGYMRVEGKICSMFELATGFEMEQSGWDNIYLRGLMLGETPKSIMEKMREISEFSELGEFLDMPVKYYSSGMFIRLAFSVSTAVIPDILLLDEVLGAGDAGFLKKAQRRLQNMMENARIMLLVTHSMESAIALCNRCIWIDRGCICMDGTPQEVTQAYQKAITSGR